MGFSKELGGRRAHVGLVINAGFRDLENYSGIFTPIEWQKRYFLDLQWPKMLDWVRMQGKGVGTSNEHLRSLWDRYALIQLFMGSHCLPEEKSYFEHYRDGMSLLEFYFGENVMTFEEFQKAKVLFRAPRKEFTDSFNKLMQRIYVPERY